MRFGHRSPRILFDTNAVRNFFRPRFVSVGELPALRALTASLARSGEIRPIFTQPVSWELTSLVDEEGRDAYVAVMTFYVDIAHRSFIRHEPSRMAMELRLRRALTDDEAFNEIDPTAMLREMTDDEWIRRYYATQREHKHQERATEAGKRTALVAALGEDWKERLGASFSPEHWE